MEPLIIAAIVAGIVVFIIIIIVIAYSMSWKTAVGYDIADGYNLWALPGEASIDEAKAKCSSTPGCAGFTRIEGEGSWGKASKYLVPTSKAGVVAYYK